MLLDSPPLVTITIVHLKILIQMYTNNGLVKERVKKKDKILIFL